MFHYQYTFIMGEPVLTLFLLLILITPMATADGVSLGRYRDGYQTDETLFDGWMPDRSFHNVQFLQEPLYANANATVKVPPIRKIAIIGGGIAGVSIAHGLKDDRCERNILRQVTIFEKDSRLGGRIHTVPKYGSGRWTVETGGDMFDDGSLALELARDVGVTVRDEREYDRFNTPLSRIKLWDGSELIDPREMDSEQQTWTDLARILWQYGRSFRFWLRIPGQLWSAIQKRDPWFDDCLVIFFRTAFGAATGPHRNDMNRFAASMGLSLKRQKATVGGNQRLLKRAVKMSEASLRLQSTVTRITRFENLTFDVHWSQDNETHVERFDAVVIAAPFHQASIIFDPPLQSVPEEVEYTSLHVTHFISRRPLDPITFNLSPNQSVPDIIWNIYNQSNPESSTLSFLTLTRTSSYYLQGCDVQEENLFKVTSSNPLSDDGITILLKKTSITRKTVTFPDQSCYVPQEDSPLGSVEVMREELQNKEIDWDDREIHDDEWYLRNLGCVNYPTVRWVHRETWPSALPVVDKTSPKKNDQIHLAPRLFYVSGFEGRLGASISSSVARGSAIVRQIDFDI